MMHEDESPMVENRSLFDTEPCPPPEPLYIDGVPHLYAKEPLSGLLYFQGGEVEFPKPTRAQLLESAQQWATAVREHLIDWDAHTDAAKGMCDRLDAVLAELAAL